MGMVEGPFSKEEAASRCGCDSEDLCPGPLAGIDKGDKIRTIYDGSVGGANGYMRQLRRGDRQTSTWGWLWPEPGTRWVLLKADVTKAHRRVKVLSSRKTTGGRMVGEQGRYIWHGQCPILLGTPGSSSAPGPLRAFPSSGLELRLRLPVAASKRGGGELGGGAAGHTPGLGHPT